MKYLILSALGMIAQYSFSGGHRTAEDILNQRIANEKRYILNPGSMGSIVIEMSYGKTDYLTPAEKQILEKAQLLQVHLVYTDYPKNEDFMALNRSRIKRHRHHSHTRCFGLHGSPRFHLEWQAGQSPRSRQRCGWKICHLPP